MPPAGFSRAAPIFVVSAKRVRFTLMSAEAKGESKLKKFAIFTLNNGPYQSYEGDFIQMDKEYVQVLKYTDVPGHNELIAAIRLDKGQSVKEVQ